MSTRQKAMIWWNELTSAEKTRLCDLNAEYLKGIRRWETLTGREIEYIFFFGYK